MPWFGLVLFDRLKISEHSKRANYYNRKPVPNAQGIWLRITLLILIILLGSSHLNNQYMLIYIGATSLLALLATVDLFYPLPSRFRFVVQIIIFAIIVLWGDVAIDSVRVLS